MSAAPDSSRTYRRRKQALKRVQDRLRVEQRKWHSVWIADTVPSPAVRDLIDELVELVEAEG